MWRSYLARVLVWFVALAGLGLYATAQTNTGNVYGNVIDEQGMAVPGGTATLTGPSAPSTTSVDANGFFRFLKIPPGKYSVTVTMPGFTTVTRENVSVSVGRNTQVDVQLKLSTIQEAVTVTSATPLIDTRKVKTGQNFSREELTEIPTSRDIWSLIREVPGVQIDTVNVAGNQSGIAGGPDFISKGSGNVVYQVDGATSTDNTYGNPFVVRGRERCRRNRHRVIYFFKAQGLAPLGAQGFIPFGAHGLAPVFAAHGLAGLLAAARNDFCSSAE